MSVACCGKKGVSKMKHRVKVTASWWVNVDGIDEDEEYYEDMMLEGAINQVVEDEDMIEDADWDAELVE